MEYSVNKSNINEVFDSISKELDSEPNIIIETKSHRTGKWGMAKLCEVKTSKKSTFSKKQKEFIPTWRGGWTLLITTEDCENLVNSIKKEVLAINKSEYFESDEWEKGLI